MDLPPELADELTNLSVIGTNEQRLGRIHFPRKVRRRWQVRMKSKRPLTPEERHEFLTFIRLEAGLPKDVMPGQGLVGKKCGHCFQPITSPEGCDCYKNAATGVYRTDGGIEPDVDRLLTVAVRWYLVLVALGWGMLAGLFIARVLRAVA